MASNSSVYLGFALILIVFLAGNAMAGRNIPENAKFVDKKEPEWLGYGHYDGTVLIPGLGRFAVPKKGSYINPFTYNPITGKNDGNGFSIPGVSGTGHSSIPGGDDTFLPNPAGVGLSGHSHP